LNAQWVQLSGNVDALSLRERALVLFSILTLLYVLWDALLFAPQARNAALLQNQLATQLAQVRAKQDEWALFKTIADGGASSPEHLKQQALKQELAVLDERLSSLSQGLVAAADLPMLLQDVLSESSGLHLVSVQTLAVEPLPLDGGPSENTSAATSNGAQSDSSEKESVGVYKHSTSLKIKGGYFQVLEYVRRLESLTWRFYWDRMSYSVSTYPQAEIEIRVYTLSAEEGLLGV